MNEKYNKIKLEETSASVSILYYYCNFKNDIIEISRKKPKF